MSEPSEADMEAQRKNTDIFLNGLTDEEAEMQKEDRSKKAIKILSNGPMEFLLNEVQKEAIGNELNTELCIYSLISLNPCVDNLLHMQHIGNVQTGKSHLGLTCESLLKMSMKFPVNHMSPKYLMYASKEESVHNKLIILDDATDTDIELLKALGNNNGPAKYGTVANKKAEKFILDGEPLIWFSTVTPLTDEGHQLNSRYIMLNTDESEEHHKNVLDRFKAEAMGVRTKVPMDSITGDILEMCINNTDFNHVVLPYFEYPAGAITKYRDGKAFISLVQTVAIMNHMKRVIKDPDKTLYAAQQDVDTATKLWNAIERYNLHKLNEQQQQTYELIQEWDDKVWGTPDHSNGMTVQDLMVGRDRGRAQIYADLRVLQDGGLVIKEDGSYHAIEQI